MNLEFYFACHWWPKIEWQWSVYKLHPTSFSPRGVKWWWRWVATLGSGDISRSLAACALATVSRRSNSFLAMLAVEIWRGCCEKHNPGDSASWFRQICTDLGGALERNCVFVWPFLADFRQWRRCEDARRCLGVLIRTTDNQNSGRKLSWTAGWFHSGLGVCWPTRPILFFSAFLFNFFFFGFPNYSCWAL